MTIKGHYIAFQRWHKWGGVRWVNYDLYKGTEPPKWHGFHLHLGWGALMYHPPRT